MNASKTKVRMMRKKKTRNKCNSKKKRKMARPWRVMAPQMRCPPANRTMVMATIWRETTMRRSIIRSVESWVSQINH